MEIIIFSVLVLLMFALAWFDKQYAFLGVIGGLGLVMLAFSVQTSGLQTVTGYIADNATANLTTTLYNYTSISTAFSGLSWLDMLLSIVLGGAGVLFIMTSAIKNGGKF